MAGRRADTAGARVLPQGRGAAAKVREERAADRERPADQRHAARRGLGAVFEGASLPGGALASTARATSTTVTAITKRGEPTFDSVYAAATTLQRFGVPFNTLTCVNRFNASRPLDVYRFLRRELGSTYLQFIPIVEIRGFETTAPQAWDPARLPVVGSPESKPDHPDSVVTPWSVDADEYGQFLCKVWDEWLARGYGKVLISFCETLVVQHMGLPAQNCIQSEFCGKGVVFEHDGSVYACDHYVYPEYRLGNVREKSLGDMVFSPTQVKFGYAKSETLPAYCKRCEFLTDCWGECPKNRLLRTPEGEPGLNYLCPGLKRFYTHAVPAAEKLATQLRSVPHAPRPRM